VGAVAAVLIGWELLSRSGLGLQELFPPFEHIGAAAVEQVISGRLWPHLAASLQEIAIGFGVGTVLALVVCIPVGAHPYLRRVIEPLVAYAGVVPLLILFPIFLLLFGIGANSKSAMAALSAFFPVAMSTLGAYYQVKPIYVRVGQVLGASRWQMYTQIYLPAMLGPVLVGVRLGLAVAIVGALLAETKIARAGLGYSAMDYYQHFNIPAMYAVLLIVFLLASGLNAAFDLVLGRVLRYRSTSTSPSQFF
jgi:ABC-type nitrate/sulfonate/bicarbonate transport system permease component